MYTLAAICPGGTAPRAAAWAGSVTTGCRKIRALSGKLRNSLRIACLLLAAALLIAPARPAGARPITPELRRLLGDPVRWSAYWHDQRDRPGDAYACALYAQASVLEALGYDFETELAAARVLGERDRWYTPTGGAYGLGQPLRARGIAFAVFGSPLAEELTPSRALLRLEYELAAGRLALVNVDAWRLAYYRGSPVRWHTLWITGLRRDEQGRAQTIIANDSTRGAAVEYGVDEFLDAWGSEFNYYAIFVRVPESSGGS